MNSGERKKRWDEAGAVVADLGIGDVIRCPEHEGVIPEPLHVRGFVDGLVVVRSWWRTKQRWQYEVLSREWWMARLSMIEVERRSKQQEGDARP